MGYKGSAKYPCLAQNLKKLRTERGLTQRELADKLNVVYQSISAWESGRADPRKAILDDICTFFDVDCNNLCYCLYAPHISPIQPTNDEGWFQPQDSPNQGTPTDNCWTGNIKDHNQKEIEKLTFLVENLSDEQRDFIIKVARQLSEDNEKK